MTPEPIIDRDRRIIDAHHHLRDRDGELYLEHEFLADLACGHRVVASVAVETGVHYLDAGPEAQRPSGETAFLAGIAERCEARGEPRVATAIVAYADLRLGDDVDAVLAAHANAGRGRLRGIRMATPWHGDERLRYPRSRTEPGMLRDPQFGRGFARLAPHALAFDAWVYHTQLDDVADLAQRFPDTTIVLDHLGGPIGAGPFAHRRDEVFAAWRSSLRRLAQCANVMLKVGGLGMPIIGFGFDRAGARPASATLAEAWRPWVETAVAAFGAARCMFESNFPPDRVSADYSTVWNAFKRITMPWSEAERAMLFAGTAARVYRIED